MFGFIKRFFGGNQEETDPEQIIEEYWQTEFKRQDQSRFHGENTETYTTDITSKGLVLSSNRKNVFVWTVDPLYRYRDFVIEALIEFPGTQHSVPENQNSAQQEYTKNKIETDTGAGKMAAGFLFRYITESTFYSVLLSEHGMIRMDVLINGTPVPILGWTETSMAESKESIENEKSQENKDDVPPYQKDSHVFSIRIIAQETSFTLIVNDRWVAECTDDTIQAGGNIAFAIQNWNYLDRAQAVMHAIAVESRPIEVETLYTRWNQYIKIRPAAHVSLARTWYAMGKYVPAIIELKRAWKTKEPEAEELLLSTQIYLAQRLLPEAESQARKAFKLDQNNPRITAELGGILYLQNRFPELDELLESIPRETIDTSPFLSNLEGHLFHWKNLPEQAAETYHRAACLTPDQGIFSFSEGNEWQKSKNKERAVDAWLEAARRFLAEESYADLETVIGPLSALAPEDVRVLAIRGKYLYAIERPTEAFTVLEQATKKGTSDSAVWYLYGILLADQGRTADAISALQKAISIEPEYGQYHFRLAETLFYAEIDCASELKCALQTASENGWVYNLAALKSLKENNLDEAETTILKARQLLPDELPVLVNFAEVKRSRGKLNEVLPLLDSNDADRLRAGANLLVADGRHEEAEEWYIRALRYCPFDPELLTDRAANCLKLDLLNEADDLLRRALDLEPSPRIYQLISCLAGRKGEFTRAEVALLQGIEKFPDNAELFYELSAVYLTMKKTEKARAVADKLHILDIKLGNTVYKEIEEQTMDTLSCSICGRIWHIPKNIPSQGSLHLTAEPPDDLPAGTCPSCKHTYCIGCVKETLGNDGRFYCPKCGIPLKLINQGVIWLLNCWQNEKKKFKSDI